jgi:DNA-binding transcriptional MerR regulator
MEYSVEDVCKLANISVRTLHYYDEIGLLTPGRKINGWRYYTDEQVLKLMDIIFFKKLGFNLKKIASMLALGNKDKRALMIAKKTFFEKEINRLKDLIKYIDETLEYYLKGENINYSQKIKQFENFQKEAKKDEQNFLKEFGLLEDEENKKIKDMSIDEQLKNINSLFKNVEIKKYSQKLTNFFKKLTSAIDNNLKEDSEEVQALMQQYFDTLFMIKPISKKEWLKMGIEILKDKITYIAFTKIHSKMPEFLASAIKIYGKNIKDK